MREQHKVGLAGPDATAQARKLFGEPLLASGVVGDGALTMVGIAVWRTTSTANRFMASAMITGMLFTALLYLGYLTYLEIFVIEAICQWCVAYLIVSAIWFALEAWGLWNGMSADDLAFED